MIFQTKYDKLEDHLSYVSSAGVEEEIIYDYSIDIKTGVKSLVPVGKTSIKDYIQSHKDSVDLNKLMERFRNGETDVFNRNAGFYADVTEMPTTYPEMFARVQAAENVFFQLDPEVRAKFNNSPSEFFAQYGSDQFNEIMASHFVEPDLETVADLQPVIDESEVK